jgi:hypothetical protein
MKRSSSDTDRDFPPAQAAPTVEIRQEPFPPSASFSTDPGLEMPDENRELLRGLDKHEERRKDEERSGREIQQHLEGAKREAEKADLAAQARNVEADSTNAQAKRKAVTIQVDKVEDSLPLARGARNWLLGGAAAIAVGVGVMWLRGAPRDEVVTVPPSASSALQVPNTPPTPNTLPTVNPTQASSASASANPAPTQAPHPLLTATSTSAALPSTVPTLHPKTSTPVHSAPSFVPTVAPITPRIILEE